MNVSGRRRTGIWITVLCSLLYGIYPACVRAVYDDGGNPAFMLIAGTWTRALGLLLVCLYRREKLFHIKADRREAFKGGVLQASSAASVALALVYLPGPLVIITLFSHTLMLLFFLAWKKEIKLDKVTVLTTLIALGGLSLVLDLWHAQPVQHLWGIGLAFFAALVIVLRSYVYEKQTRHRYPAAVGAESFLVAAAATLLFCFYQTPHVPASVAGLGWAALAAVTMALGTIASFFSIATLGAFRASLISKLEPVFTAIFSAVLIGEVLKTDQYIGVGIVLGSLLLFQMVDGRRLKQAVG